MTEVRWTIQAADDLEAIYEFIGRDSPQYARMVVERLMSVVEQLGRFPDSGREVPEYANPVIREVIRRPYRIVYRRGTDIVEILTIFHGARSIPNLSADDEVG